MLLDSLVERRFVGEANAQLGELLVELLDDGVEPIDFSGEEVVLSWWGGYFVDEALEVLLAELHLQAVVLFLQVVNDLVELLELGSYLGEPK